MTIRFDGRKFRDEVLAEIKEKIDRLSLKLVLAVVWIGNDPVSARYVEQKQRAAEFLGIHFDILKFPKSVETSTIAAEITKLNANPQVTGIMMQLPVPRTLDQKTLILAISPEKDVDALRFCSNLECTFRPPVTLAVLQVLKKTGIDLKTAKVSIIGKGFLVGEPLVKILQSEVADLRVADDRTPNLPTMTLDADVIISATGHPGLIKPGMIRKGVILIDAGTAEVDGALRGDIDPRAYKKSSLYTPVPGGIGPMTVAVLYKNLLTAALRNQK